MNYELDHRHGSNVLRRLFGLFGRHWWAVGVAHIVSVLVLFTLFINTRPIIELARSFSRLPENDRVGISLLVLALLTGTYAILLLELSIRQRREERQGRRMSAALIGFWESSLSQAGDDGARLSVVVSPNDRSARLHVRLSTAVGREAHGEPAAITTVHAGEVFVMRTSVAPGDDRSGRHGQAQLRQLELVLCDSYEPYLVLRRDAGPLDDAVGVGEPIILTRAASGQTH